MVGYERELSYVEVGDMRRRRRRKKKKKKKKKKEEGRG